MEELHSEKQIIPFKYQLYWTRAFSFIPVIFLLAWIEYELYGRQIPVMLYLTLSILITFLFVLVFYRPLQKYFLREGKIEITENAVAIVARHKRRVFPISEISEVSVDRISMYGSTFDKMTITGNKVSIGLYSDEIRGEDARETDNDYSFLDISEIISDRIGQKSRPE